MTARPPRGIRNNNPGNIEYNEKQKWQGLAGTDGRFAKFTESKWGIRAMAKLIGNYQKLHGLDTIEKIIHRWAPPHENKTGIYADVVATAVGVDVNEAIDVHSEAVMLPLIKAMITMENGQQPYSDDQIKQGMTLAGIECLKTTKPLIKSRTMQGAAVAGVGVVAMSTENQDLMLALAGLVSPDIASAIPELLALVGILQVLYARWDDHRKKIK
jgi:hypothetical protein